MLTIIFCWLVLGLSIYLIGHLLLNKRILKHFNFSNPLEWYEYFWIGFVITIVILQTWSLFLPVNIYALISIFVLSIISLSLHKNEIIIPKFNFKFLFIISIVLLVLSYYASQPVGWDDTLLYHLNAVKWSNLYPVVPGLANLHSRLGFNSSFFLFASMIDNWFLKDRSSHVAASLLVSTFSIEIVWIFFKSQNKILKVFCLLISPFIISSVVKSGQMSSLSPDLVVSIVALAISIEIIKNSSLSLFIASLFSLLLFTIKPSGFAFAAMIVVYVLFNFLKTSKKLFLPPIFFILISTMIVLIPYFGRNIFLSGWFLYPYPLFKTNVEWAVPDQQVALTFNVVKAWAKFPGPGWNNYIYANFWEWFPSWFSRNARDIEIKLIFFTLLVSVAKFFINVSKKLNFLTLISFISILYIFLSAPDFRFGAVYVWIFFASVVAPFISNTVRINKEFATLIFLFFLFYISWPPKIEAIPILKSVRWEQPWPTNESNGILIPVSQNLCGNSDLPCTPETNTVRWRVPGDLSKGFTSVN